MPGFHALSGADNRKRQAKTFQEAGLEVITALADLNTNEKPTKATEAALEHFVCQLYVPNTVITQVNDARWWLFRIKQAQSDRLPTTKAALHEVLMRAQHQAMVWNNDKVANPELPSPEDYG